MRLSQEAYEQGDGDCCSRPVSLASPSFPAQLQRNRDGDALPSPTAPPGSLLTQKDTQGKQGSLRGYSHGPQATQPIPWKSLRAPEAAFSREPYSLTMSEPLPHKSPHGNCSLKPRSLGGKSDFKGETEGTLEPVAVSPPPLPPGPRGEAGSCWYCLCPAHKPSWGPRARNRLMSRKWGWVWVSGGCKASTPIFAQPRAHLDMCPVYLEASFLQL